METINKEDRTKVIIIGGVAGGASCAARLDELPRDREIHVVCRSGQRAYYATRILLQNGFNVRNFAGGMMSRENLVEV
jgi:rhodanese-related sulfurtransferase